MYQSYRDKCEEMAGENKVPALVTVDWLKENINSSDIKIVDGTYHLEIMKRDAKAEHKEKHIPGAVYFDIDECADTSSSLGLPHMVPSPEQFEGYVGSRGIKNDSYVIVYDNHPQFPVFSAQRVWWTFKIFGHEKVSVLEGGLQKWLAAGGEVTSESTEVTKEAYKAQYHPEFVTKYEDVEKNIQAKEFQLVDARPPGRFQGTAPEPMKDVKPGHIPTAINAPFMKLMDTEKKTYRSQEELMKFFKDHGVDLNKKVAFTCGSGLQASNLALAAYMCGKKDASLYDGSWVEWFRRAPADLMKNVPSE